MKKLLKGISKFEELVEKNKLDAKQKEAKEQIEKYSEAVITYEYFYIILEIILTICIKCNTIVI